MIQSDMMCLPGYFRKGGTGASWVEIAAMTVMWVELDKAV